MKNIFISLPLAAFIAVSSLQQAPPAIATENTAHSAEAAVYTAMSLAVNQEIFTGADGKLYTATSDNFTGVLIVEEYSNPRDNRSKPNPEIPIINSCTVSILGMAILALGSVAISFLAANPAGAVIAGVALTSAELSAVASLLAAGATIESILVTLNCGNN